MTRLVVCIGITVLEEFLGKNWIKCRPNNKSKTMSLVNMLIPSRDQNYRVFSFIFRKMCFLRSSKLCGIKRQIYLSDFISESIIRRPNPSSEKIENQRKNQRNSETVYTWPILYPNRRPFFLIRTGSDFFGRQMAL